MLISAGRPLPAAVDDVRRYCGLPWSGGKPEVWAYAYFDAVGDASPATIGPVDVLTTAALHPELGRAELSYFVEYADELATYLEDLPREIDLADAPDMVVAVVAQLPHFASAISLSLLSKVVHRKRPRLVPMLDRAIVDRYRKRTASRGEAAWHPLVRELRRDLSDESNRSFLGGLQSELAEELHGPVPSGLRLLDIGVWMDSRR